MFTYSSAGAASCCWTKSPIMALPLGVTASLPIMPLGFMLVIGSFSMPMQLQNSCRATVVCPWYWIRWNKVKVHFAKNTQSCAGKMRRWICACTWMDDWSQYNFTSFSKLRAVSLKSEFSLSLINEIKLYWLHPIICKQESCF